MRTHFIRRSGYVLSKRLARCRSLYSLSQCHQPPVIERLMLMITFATLTNTGPICQFTLFEGPLHFWCWPSFLPWSEPSGSWVIRLNRYHFALPFNGVFHVVLRVLRHKKPARITRLEKKFHTVVWQNYIWLAKQKRKPVIVASWVLQQAWTAMLIC